MLNTVPEAVVWAIFLLPISSFVIIGLFARPWPRWCGYITIAVVGLSFLLSLWVLDSVIQEDGRDLAFATHQWLTVGSLTVNLGLTVDGLTAIMLMVVTSVSFLVQVYSQGYMHGDPGYSRYYAFMSLFTGSMLGLVLAENLIMLYVFWELVGLCSYLLIGFWFERPAARAAATKAFIVTRLGDLGFLTAIILIWSQTGELDIPRIQEMAMAGAIGDVILTWLAAGVFAGAMGKSAQFPLHVWLPDAMEGPTPVSALIHAATMVAAGVYLVARLFPIFSASDVAMNTVAVVGGITAVVAASMGIVMTDIKRVIAYSTISQLGYMMLGLGVGGLAAGVFHLLNHAFFKALLFLGAGSVNHATNTFDMRKMGGLRRFMPWTFTTFVIAALSLAGIFPLSGFWSKDEILTDAWDERRALAWVGLVVAFMTALYIGRVVFLTFGGDYRGGEAPSTGSGQAPAGDHSSTRFQPHESPPVMVLPMIVLAVAAVLTGFLNVGEGVTHLLEGWLPPEALERTAKTEFNLGVAAMSLGFAVAGLTVAWLIYGARLLSAETLRRMFGPVHRLLVNKYYLDWLYEDILVRRVLVRGVSTGLDLFDRYVVDGVVNATAWATRFSASRLRLVQAGQLQVYGAAIFLGIVLIVAAILIVNP
ncbi:MAG: NADH-quinone oxidoreductase subunit L [Chloroflexota bacterium]|nr:NADH-quinone oxidoreductase subunit L [Chloroflexota bacterium]